jgi:hypothetical protein
VACGCVFVPEEAYLQKPADAPPDQGDEAERSEGGEEDEEDGGTAADFFAVESAEQSIKYASHRRIFYIMLREIRQSDRRQS